MKKNNLLKIYTGSRIANCLQKLKQVLCFFPPRVIVAGLLMMMLTVTIIPARGSAPVDEGRWLRDFDLNLKVEGGPGCFGPVLPADEVAWKYIMAGKKVPEGRETANALLLLTSDLPSDRPASLDSVDPQIGSLRLLGGSVLGLRDDSGKTIASVSTSYADTKTLYSIYDGSYFINPATL